MCTRTEEPSERLKRCVCALALSMIALYSVSTVLITAPAMQRKTTSSLFQSGVRVT